MITATRALLTACVALVVLVLGLSSRARSSSCPADCLASALPWHQRCSDVSALS